MCLAVELISIATISISITALAIEKLQINMDAGVGCSMIFTWIFMTAIKNLTDSFKKNASEYLNKRIHAKSFANYLENPIFKGRWSYGASYYLLGLRKSNRSMPVVC